MQTSRCPVVRRTEKKNASETKGTRVLEKADVRISLPFTSRSPNPFPLPEDKFNQSKKRTLRAEDVVEVVEHLPSMCKALNSNLSTAKKRKKKRRLHWRVHLKELICQEVCLKEKKWRL
jgi:hypothetical protein